MISAKKLINMARTWQKLAAMNRKRIPLRRSRTISSQNLNHYNNTSPIMAANKGHFVVYTADQQRFVLPMAYLNNDVFKKLLEMAEEEFGLPNNGPITLPFDAVLMDYAIALVKQHAAKDLQKAFLVSISRSSCSSSSYCHQEQTNQQLLICSF